MGLVCESEIKEVVGGMNLGLVGLRTKGVLAGKLLF